MKRSTSIALIGILGLAALVAGPGTADATTTYPVVDTGQDVCYENVYESPCPAEGEPFYGQDAQIDGNQPSYTISDDSLTVLDNVTGLTWIRKPDTDGDGDLDTYDQLTWSEFLSFPATLNAQSFGGYNDWREPTIKELYSLIDFRGLDPSAPGSENLRPFIDTTYFDFVYGDTTVGERIIDAQYWSSNVYVGTVFDGEIAVFGVNFADGRIKGYPRDVGPGGVAVHYARYVRGNPEYGINDFVDNGDGTVTDQATGLMWAQEDHGNGVGNGPRSGILWEDALAWVQQMNDENYLGYDDWHLPNAKEMQSILDYSRGPDATDSAAIDPIFQISEITNEAGQVDYPWFWTSTSHVSSNGLGGAAAYICFGRSLGYFGPPGNKDWLDVHGAGAQRSDKKDGNFGGYVYVPDGYYFPQAPQGDAARMYNYVRCVREASPETGVDDTESDLGDALRLRVSENPSRSESNLVFSLPTDGSVTVAIYDTRGRRVCTLLQQRLSGGEHQVRWDGTGADGSTVADGIYFARLTSGPESVVVKVVRMR